MENAYVFRKNPLDVLPASNPSRDMGFFLLRQATMPPRAYFFILVTLGVLARIAGDQVGV